MILPNIENFIGCDSSFEEAGIVLYGAPFDSTTSFRPGARFGPSAIRHISKRNCYIKTTRPIATYDVVLDNMFHFRNELNPVSTFQMAAYIFSDPADASSISTALTKKRKPHFYDLRLFTNFTGDLL